MAGGKDVFPTLFDKVQDLDNRFRNFKNKVEKKVKEGKQGLGLKTSDKKKEK